MISKSRRGRWGVEVFFEGLVLIFVFFFRRVRFREDGFRYLVRGRFFSLVAVVSERLGRGFLVLWLLRFAELGGILGI